MQLPAPLFRGTLVRRYKRFLADVILECGETVTAHCPNPGSMLGLNEPGLTVWLSRSDDPRRKLAHTWQLLEVDGAMVGINTHLPNAIAAEAIAAGRVPELAGYDGLRREVPYGANSRVDILLEGGRDGRPAYVEIKNVHLRRGGSLAEFPDCPTARGVKHLTELGTMAEAGARAVMLFVVQRTDCRRFAIAGDIDPAYEAAFEQALARGVEAICYDCRIGTREIVLNRAREITLPPGKRALLR